MAPVLAEKISAKTVMFIAFFGQGIGVFLLFTADSTLDFYIFAVTWAIPYGGEGTAFPVLIRKYYGHAPMGTTYGWQLLGAGLGMAVGGMIPGMVFDISGTYTWAIVLSGAFSLVGALAIVLLESTKKQLIPDWPVLEDNQEKITTSVATSVSITSISSGQTSGD